MGVIGTNLANELGHHLVGSWFWSQVDSEKVVWVTFDHDGCDAVGALSQDLILEDLDQVDPPQKNMCLWDICSCPYLVNNGGYIYI